MASLEELKEIGHYPDTKEVQKTLQFAFEAKKHWGAIIEVLEAAREFSSSPFEDFRGGLNNDLLDQLKAALEELEKT